MAPVASPSSRSRTRAAPRYSSHDRNGSTRALLTSAGTIGATFVFSAYGTLTKSTGTLTTSLLFAQSYTDSVTGLDYLINRYYDPSTGDFLTVDGAVDQTGQPYSYAGDDAVNFEDPLGESLWGAIAHWYDRNKATIETTLEVTGDVLALAALLTPEGWVTDAVEVTAAIVADTFAVMTCADSPRSDGCYEAIGSAALGALGVKFALGKSLTGDAIAVGSFLLEDIPEVQALVKELDHSTSPSASSGSAATGNGESGAVVSGAATSSSGIGSAGTTC